MYVDDPAIDLAVVAALISSYEEKVIPAKVAFAAEVGLSGEIRAVSRIDQRIAEADKLGFDKIFISKYNAPTLDTTKTTIEVESISKVQQLVELLF
jgi:DNA repair protein RadA/Sms